MVNTWRVDYKWDSVKPGSWTGPDRMHAQLHMYDVIITFYVKYKAECL